MDVHNDLSNHRTSWFRRGYTSSWKIRPSGSRRRNAVASSPLPLVACLAGGMLLLARLADARLASGMLLLALSAAPIDGMLLRVTRPVSTAF
jgi:hypothetical protein